MIELSGIRADALYQQDERFLFYTGVVTADGRPCLLRALSRERPDESDVRLIRSEIRLRRRLRGGAPELLDVREHARGPILILADPGGERLRRIAEGGELAADRFLRIAIAMADAVESIHASDIVHRSLRMDCFVIDESQGRASVLDFSAASRLSRLNREIESEARFRGDFACLAPEQSGRMNRAVDYRADLYALGCVYFMLWCGRPPFRAASPAEWFYAHIAREAPALARFRADTPTAFDAILRRLLAKDPEDRYQSAAGLATDLRRLRQLLDRGAGDEFRPGVLDAPERFQLSQRLYGRESELAALEAALDAVRGARPRLTLVQGAPGAGKSALIRELEKRAAERAAFFAHGKFEQYERAEPFRAWIGAARRLLATLGELAREERTRLVERLKSEIEGAAALTGLLPELGALLGVRNAGDELDSGEARNRFQAAALAFFRIFAAPERPLSLFLDDLQWADRSSLDLLRALLTDPGQNSIHVIAAARNAGAHDASNVESALEELERLHAPVERIELTALSPDDVNRWICASLSRSPESTRQLSAAICERAGGNPFHIVQQLFAWREEGRIQYDVSERMWTWDAELTRLNNREDVSEFLARKIGRLSPPARRALAAAAALGGEFRADLLAAALGDTSELEAALEEALDEALLFAAGDAVDDPGPRGERRFIFVHDRVQQAAYRMLPEAERRQVHLAAGRTLARSLEAPASSNRLFAAASHLNHALDSLSDPEERRSVLALNLRAARLARENAAWETALDCSRAALSLLEPECWRWNPALAFAAHLEALESEYLAGDRDQAEALFRRMRSEMRDPLELSRAYRRLATLYTNIGRLQDAIQLAREGLARLGVRLRARPGVVGALLETLQVSFFRRGRTPRETLDLPPMSDQRVRCAMDLLMAAAPAAFFLDQNLFASITLRMTRFSYQFGLCRVSSFGFMTYAVLLQSVFGKFKEATEFGEVALELNERFKTRELEARLLTIFGAFLNHWEQPLRTNAAHLRRAFRAGLETGDLVYAGYALANRIFAASARGESLAECDRQSRAFLRFAERSGDRDVAGDFLLTLQASKHLAGLTRNRLSFSDGEYDEDAHSAELETGNPVTLIYALFLRVRNFYILGEVRAAEKAALRLLKIDEPARPLALGPAVLFYSALACAAARRENLARPGTRAPLARAIRAYRRWAKLQSAHFEPRLAMLEGEALADRGRYLQALAAYDRAMIGAERDEEAPLRAISAERSARVMLSVGMNETALTRLADARYHYLRWGATLKARDLEAEFPALRARSEPTRGEGRLADSRGGGLDAIAALKAAAAISSEIAPARLVERVLEALMTLAGARHGCYLRATDEGLRVIAIGELGEELRIAAPDLPLKAVDSIPTSVVAAAVERREVINIADAAQHPEFGADPAILRRAVKSAFCMPILLKGALAGVLYLENDLLPGAFPEQLAETLQILAAQAAVSLENASLYADLEQKVQERTRELEGSLRETRSLKQTQDLDYYLTSLLMEPLSGVRIGGERLRFQAVIRQKKTFQFKKWSAQIGGDICIARETNLGGKRYQVFANADAMGKSLQGAGGALVFGAVFEALAARATALAGVDAPEAWLRFAHEELNRVFCSFNGYMLVSAVMGAADESTGEVWFLNCDHPAPALASGGAARFLSVARPAQKLGMTLESEAPAIERLQLAPGDRFVSGSDGRDDLDLARGAGEERLNEDPGVFLRAILDAPDGRPQSVLDGLLAAGELTDDVSLLIIERVV